MKSNGKSNVNGKQSGRKSVKSLSKNDLEKFKKLLFKKRDEMLKNLGLLKDREMTSTLKDASGQNLAYSLHMADVGTDNMEREKAFFFATREGKFLNHIEQALQRVESGDYGNCIDCQIPIPGERLEAVPTATRCVPCKEKADGIENENGVPMHSHAAT